jgi:hypothetical protein
LGAQRPVSRVCQTLAAHAVSAAIVTLDGVGESGDKARMHAMRDSGWAPRSVVSGTAADAVARRAVSASTRVVHRRGARCWQILKARTTVPLRVRDKYGAV